MKGRLAVIKEYGKPLEIEEYDVPEPEPGGTVNTKTLSPLHWPSRFLR